MTKAEAITTVNKSANSKYAPIVSIIATNAAEIADKDITLLFIIYNNNCKAYPYSTKSNRKLSNYPYRHPFGVVRKVDHYY